MSSTTTPSHTSPLAIVDADLSRPDHQADTLFLVDAYARDPMGNGRPLDPEIKAALIPGLRQHPTTVILLAYAAAQPVGIAVCFRGFSTFHARPLLNLHDLTVVPAQRGRGVGRALLAAVEAKARALGCCKVTLEVQDDNHRAQQIYAAAGFTAGSPGASIGARYLGKLL